MSDIIRSLNYVLDCSSKRMMWYIDTGDEKYLKESKIYFDVANFFMRKISEQKDLV